jgi:hypothetical protein
MLEMILPEYIKQLMENYQYVYSQLASQLRWLYFDDYFRLVTRVGYLDDGWIRVRVDGASALDINLVEVLRELSWLYYSVAEMTRNLDMLKNALESVGTDKFRVSVVDALPESPLNITKVAGTALTARDWSQDFAKLQNLDVALSSRASESTLSAIAGALASRATDKLRVSVVDVLPESPFNLTKVAGATLTARDWSQDFAKLQNLDVALSTRASEATLSAVRDRLPPSLTADGNFRVALLEDAVGLARESTLSAIKSKTDNLDVALSTRASEATLSGIKAQIDKLTFDANSYLQVNVMATVNPPNLDVALSTRASEATLQAVRDRLPSSLTTAGNFRVAILEDAVGLAKEATLSAIKNALASVGTDKLRVSVVDALPESPINISRVGGTALTGRDWSQDFAKLQNLDVALSTRASESTLSSFSAKFPSATALSDNLSNPSTTIVGSAMLGWDGSYWRRVAVDASSRLRTVVESVANPPNLDVALSTRASESTLSAIAGALASRATDKLRVSVVDALPRSPFTLYDSAGNELSGYVKNLDVPLSSLKASVDSVNIAKVAGTALTPRDWSSDFARLQNLDIALSGLRDAITSKLDEAGKLVLLDYTTTPLPANASWTSPVDSDPATGRIVGSVYADQPGTICVEQSGDGANWDVVDCFSVSAGSGMGFSVEKVCTYARVRYINGAADQTVFRLYVYKRLRVV